MQEHLKDGIVCNSYYSIMEEPIMASDPQVPRWLALLAVLAITAPMGRISNAQSTAGLIDSTPSPSDSTISIQEGPVRMRLASPSDEKSPSDRKETTVQQSDSSRTNGPGKSQSNRIVQEAEPTQNPQPQAGTNPSQRPTPETATTPQPLTNQSPSPIPRARADVPAPNNAGPSVSSLGENRFRALGRNEFYSSPVAMSLAGSDSSRSNVSRFFGSAAHRNLLQTPEMFGDMRRPGSSIVFDPYHGSQSGSSNQGLPDQGQGKGSDFPSAASFSGMRVSENNLALPQDRIWSSYNHFHNSFLLPGGDLDLNRFTIGLEKTFHGGSSSIEFRLPIMGSLDPVDSFGSTSFAGGSFGNLDIILKHVLLATQNQVIAAGLRVESPTGSQWHASDTTYGPVDITLDPNAVYLTPYLGALREINDIWFVNSFVQLDIATGGDRLLVDMPGRNMAEYFINQPPLLQIDLGGGVWLITPSHNQIGWAYASELHVATALDDDDRFAIDPTNGLPNVFVDLTPIRTLVNLSNGLHAQFSNQTSARVGVVVPLLEDRIFDTEVFLQINRNY